MSPITLNCVGIFINIQSEKKMGNPFLKYQNSNLIVNVSGGQVCV